MMVNTQQMLSNNALLADLNRNSLLSSEVLPELFREVSNIAELLKTKDAHQSLVQKPDETEKKATITRNSKQNAFEDFLRIEPRKEDLNLLLIDPFASIKPKKSLEQFPVESNNREPQFAWLSSKFDPLVYKLGADLAALSGELSTAYTAFVNESSLLEIQSKNQGKVVIDAYATTTSSPEQLLSDLEGLGLINGTIFQNAVSGILSTTSLAAIASLDSLHFARTPHIITNVGTTTSQADVAIRSNVARNRFNLDGTGVTVGILSDSYDNLGGANADVFSGDLPGFGNPLGNNIPVNVLQELPSDNDSFPRIDEGRAIAQLVHDLAPGAGLAFHSAALGQADLADGIIELANAGADVIVDDVIYFAEPMFQDGIIAQAVDQVVAEGVAYFSSAGNGRRNSYESNFRNSGQTEPLFGGELHDFDPGMGVDVFQSLTIPEGSTLIISFQWDSPFFSVSGGAGSPNDLDIFLFDSTGTIPIAGGVNFNIGADAVEVFGFRNDGSFGTDQFNLAISRFAGSDAGFIKYVRFGGSAITVNEYDTQSPTTYGHSNANGAEAVGAAFYQNTPEFDVAPPRLEPFSSAGGTPILFDTAGNPLPEPEIRQKPEIVAPDGVNTTFFPPGSRNQRDRERDDFPNFFGTSAAAPHAAAVAALMLEAAPGTRPQALYQAMEDTAIDMDDPSTPGFDRGFDHLTGYGLIQADAAIQEVLGKRRDDDDDFELDDDDDDDDDDSELDDDDDDDDDFDDDDFGVSEFLNGGFERINFRNWQTLGNTSIKNANFGINPTEGNKQALLTNGSHSVRDLELEVFVGLRPGELNSLTNGFTTEGSAIKQTVKVSAGDIFSFDWHFLTDENTPDSIFDDFAFVSIIPGKALELANTRSDFIPSGTIFNEETGYAKFTHVFDRSGIFTLAVGIIDVVDNNIDSALLVDNFSIT